MATSKTEAVTETAPKATKPDPKVEAFLDEFASNPSRRRAMSDAIEAKIAPDAFIEQFGNGNELRDRYIKAHYAKVI